MRYIAVRIEPAVRFYEARIPVRTHIEPMSAFEGLPTASRCLADNVRRATRKEFRHYKGLSDSRIVDRILAFLESHSRDTPGPEEALGAPAARDGAY